MSPAVLLLAVVSFGMVFAVVAAGSRPGLDFSGCSRRFAAGHRGRTPHAPGGSPTNRLTISMMLATTYLVALAAPAHAGTTQTHSFEGSCAIVGNARLADPIGPVPTWSKFEYKGNGTCQGTLDRRTIPEVGAPVRFVSSGRRLQSCEAGYDPNISWVMKLYPRDPRRTTIVGTAEVVDALRGQFMLLRGQRSGIATGLNQLQGHMETLMRCAEGTLTGGTVGGQLDTITPLVWDDPRPRVRGEKRRHRA